MGVPIAIALAAMVLSKAVHGETGTWWDVAWTAAAVSALSGTLLGRHAASPANRVHWTLWAAASTCWLAGQAGWDVFSIVSPDRLPTSPNVADVGWWAFAIPTIRTK